MDLYGQEPEIRLLRAFLPLLESRSVVDVGAEHGAFVEELLGAGADVVHAIEPEPENAAFLRNQFAGDERVVVHEYAISSDDGELELHKSTTPTGEPVPFGHTLLHLPDSEQVIWRETVKIAGRSLASLVDAGEIPPHVGILKIDTEGHDLAVVAGMGGLEADVVMVEHWTDLPLSLGPCPWSTEQMASALRDRGFSQFACVVHQGAFTNLLWNDGDIPEGVFGNLLFLHDRVFSRLLPEVVVSASLFVKSAIQASESGASAALERLKVIQKGQELQAKASREQLAVIKDVKGERDLQSKAAKDRLATIKKLERLVGSLQKAAKGEPKVIAQLKGERDLQSKAAKERLATIKKLERLVGSLQKAAKGEPKVIAQLKGERDLQSKAAKERLATIKKLERETVLLQRAAEEALGTITVLEHELNRLQKANVEQLEELTAERDLQAKAAQERLATIKKLESDLELQLKLTEELKRERDLQAQAAEERLLVIKELERESRLRLLALEGSVPSRPG